MRSLVLAACLLLIAPGAVALDVDPPRTATESEIQCLPGSPLKPACLLLLQVQQTVCTVIDLPPLCDLK